MLKKILIGLGVILLLFGGYVAYLFLTTTSHSPKAVANYTKGDLTVTVDYCQPYKKERLIFGSAEDEALVPNGQYWRLGANDATEITFGTDVNFAGAAVKAGRYRMYAIPDVDYWEVRLNSELGEWGYGEPNYELDVTAVTIPVRGIENEEEQFSISFTEQPQNVEMHFKWDRTIISIPIGPGS